MRMPKTVSWVVYQTPTRIKPGVVHAVCDDREWDTLTTGRPGYYTLVQSGIASEGEAEMLARIAPTPAADPKVTGPAALS